MGDDRMSTSIQVLYCTLGVSFWIYGLVGVDPATFKKDFQIIGIGRCFVFWAGVNFSHTGGN